MTNAEISVLIPCHGTAPYLKEAVESVLSQDYKNYEIVIVLDRPSTSTTNLIEELSRSSKKITVINSESPGISSALNLGIKEISSEFIARLDADDLMEPKRLKTQIEFMKKDKSLICVGSQILIVDSNGKYLRESHFPTKPKQISKCLVIRNVIAHPSVMMRREAVIEAGMYRSEWNGAEDYDLWLRMLKIGRIANINQRLTRYRTHDDQFTRKNGQLQADLDNSVRYANLETQYPKNTLKASAFINYSIRASGFERYKKILMAGILSPRLTFQFIAYFVLTEIVNPR